MMSVNYHTVSAAVAAALYYMAASGLHAAAAQSPPQGHEPRDPAAPTGAPPVPPVPPSPPYQQYAASGAAAPSPQGYQPPQQAAAGYGAPPPAGQYAHAQGAHHQPPIPQVQYGGDQGSAQQQPTGYQQPPPVYQQPQNYQPPPVYQQQQPPPYQPPPPQHYGQPPPPHQQAHAHEQQQQREQPPPQQQQQQQYYQVSSPSPPPHRPQQQPYHPPPPQQQGMPQQAAQQQQQQINNRVPEIQGKRQPSQERQQPTRMEPQDPIAKKEKKQKHAKQKQQKQMEDPMPYTDPEVMAADEMTPEYQPRRAEEGAVADNEHQTASLMEEWEKHMQNFIPEMLVTFSLGARSDEYFYEAIETDGVFLRGGFFVGGEEGDSAVDFSITDPDGELIYKKSRSEGLFYFTAKKKGTYSFILSNHRWMKSKTVTFAIGRGAETALLPKHLNSAEDMVAQVERQLKDIQTWLVHSQAESSYLWIRQRSLNDAAQGFLQRLSWLSGIEFLMLIATAAFHARYIVGLVSDKRIL